MLEYGNVDVEVPRHYGEAYRKVEPLLRTELEPPKCCPLCCPSLRLGSDLQALVSDASHLDLRASSEYYFDVGYKLHELCATHRMLPLHVASQHH